MFAITMKVILAFVLTAIPFAFHLWIKPRQASSGKWRCLHSVLSTYYPRLRSWKEKINGRLHAIYERMKRSDNARKFFTRIFLVMLLLVQYVDFQAANAAGVLGKELLQRQSMGMGRMEYVESLSLLDNMFEGGEAISNYFYPFQTPLYVSLGCLMVVFLMSCYRVSDRVLTFLHDNDMAFAAVALTIQFMMLGHCGKFLVAAETEFIILLAAAVYPDRSFDGTPGMERRFRYSSMTKAIWENLGRRAAWFSPKSHCD